MKKVLSVILIVILSISCKKVENKIPNFEKIDKNTEIVLSQKTVSSMKQTYSLLSIKEKEILWLEKLNAVLKNDRQQLTRNQADLIIELKQLLVTNGMELLVKNPILGEDFLDKNIKNFERNFTKKQIYILIEFPYYVKNFSIFNSDSYLAHMDEELGDDGTGSNKCDCRYDLGCPGSSYCNWNDNCIGIWECGVFGGSRCRGNCK